MSSTHSSTSYSSTSSYTWRRLGGSFGDLNRSPSAPPTDSRIISQCKLCPPPLRLLIITIIIIITTTSEHSKNSSYFFPLDLLKSFSIVRSRLKARDWMKEILVLKPEIEWINSRLDLKAQAWKNSLSFNMRLKERNSYLGLIEIGILQATGPHPHLPCLFQKTLFHILIIAFLFLKLLHLCLNLFPLSDNLSNVWNVGQPKIVRQPQKPSLYSC